MFPHTVCLSLDFGTPVKVFTYLYTSQSFSTDTYIMTPLVLQSVYISSNTFMSESFCFDPIYTFIVLRVKVLFCTDRTRLLRRVTSSPYSSLLFLGE